MGGRRKRRVVREAEVGVVMCGVYARSINACVWRDHVCPWTDYTAALQSVCDGNVRQIQPLEPMKIRRMSPPALDRVLPATARTKLTEFTANTGALCQDQP
jgi:hypothetical protein